MTPDEIVAAARKAHRKYWRMSGDESEGDQRASAVTRAWQEAVRRRDPRRFQPEFPVAKNLRERIDLVDTRNVIAYELKASPNNAHFEFYRDIFKVAVARRHQLRKLSHLVFITPATAGETLRANLAGKALDLVARLGIRVEIRDI